MTIRLRLTLLYSLILALTLIVFGISLYTFQSQDTLNSLKQDLIVKSNKFIAPLQRAPLGFIAHETLLPEPPPPRTFNQFSNEQAFQNLREREIVRVLDAFGNLVASPFGQSEDALPLSDEALQTLQKNQDVFETHLVSSEQMLIYSRPILQDEKLAYIIQVAHSLTERDRTLNSLGTILGIAGVGTLALAFAVGWILSGLALRPIDRITQTAQAIGEERNFKRRVEHTGKQDEVGKLANTFNQMLARLQTAYEKVEHALTQQKNFVSDVSHELRTPLTTLRGNLGLLMRKPSAPAEEQEDILKDMVDESDRMIRLVNELLMLAHADAERNLGKEKIDITQIVQDVVQQAQNLDNHRTIQTDLSPNLLALGDPDAIKQILLILLDNALKYSDDAIFVQAFSAQGFIKVSVKDKGKGIAPQELEHVFDRFYRSDRTSTIPGFGLGLPIAKSLAEAMEGQIAIQSKVGEGSIITFTLLEV